MGQKRIVIDLTEYQARILRMAVKKLHMTAPARLRTRLFNQKLAELWDAVQEATEDLAEIAVVPSLPQRRTLPRRHPAYQPRNVNGRFTVK